MAINNGYCTLAELKETLARTDTVKDTFLEACIERASRFIDNQTSKIYYSLAFVDESIDEYSLSTNGFYYKIGTIYLPAPIITLTNIKYNGATLTANSDYYAYKSTVEFGGTLPTGRKCLTMTGTIGYASTPLPIKQVCLTLAEVFSGLGIRTVTDGTGNEIDIIKNNIPKWALDFLKKEALYYA